MPAKSEKREDIELRAFLEEFLKNGMNGTRAAMKVWPNLDENAAAVKSCRLIRNDKFKLSSMELESPKQLNAQLENIQKQAETKEDASSQLKAVQLKAQLGGHLIQKNENINKNVLNEQEQDELNRVKDKFSNN